MSSNNINANHSISRSSLVYDKDKINFIAAICHHVDVIFSIITVIVFFNHDQLDLAGVALTLVLLDRIGQFLINGVKTYKWSKALMSLVYLDYFLELCTSQEGRGMRLFKKKYAYALLVSSPFAVLCFFGYFELSQHHGLILACGFIHAVNTIQSNLEFYSQNIVTITLKQRIYIYVFSYCEFFYRLVFLSYFKQLAGKGGIAGYLTGMFFLNTLCEFIACRREGQEKNYWVGAVLQKGWCGVFYFRLEDIMVQDADEWNEDNRNQDNHRQTTRLQNNFKSARSKMFILLRLLENLFLTITGIAQFADDSSSVALFVLAIILLPMYLLWHVKYARFSYANAQHAGTNRMGMEANNDSMLANKYKDNNMIDENNNINEEIGKLAPSLPPKQQKAQQQQLRTADNPKQDQNLDGIATYDTQLKPMQTPLKSVNNHKYTAENDGDIHQPSEQTYAGNSDSKKFNNLQQERSLSNTENKPMNSRQYSGTYRKSKKSTSNKNNTNSNGFNADLAHEEKSLDSNTKDKKGNILSANSNGHKQSYEEDEEESYGKGNNVNAFVIE